MASAGSQKQCCRCGEVKDESQFSFKNEALGVLHSYCRACHKAWNRQHYLRNKAVYLASARRNNATYIARHLRRLVEYLLEHPCVDCGEADPLVLDCDHRDPATKRAEVGSLLRYGSWAILEREIAKLPPGGPRIHMRRGAGAYICGEESSMLESIEGKRGLPRHKPPYPFQVGLFGLPTLINNVETLWWVRDIVEKGADWWKSEGRNDRHGLRSYSVSGRAKNPGMKLAPAGVTVRELIDEFCGGMADGHKFHAYLPGGASGGILPASMDNIPLDFGTLEKYGCFIGSAAVVILSDKDSVRLAALNLMRFFEDESCGQCTPCRVGTQKAALLLEKPVWNRELLDELSQAMRDASICGLGQAASNPLTSVIKYFPGEFLPKESAE